jgi:hypothetical protein
MTTRAGLLVAGLWLGLLIASWVAASVNFRTVDQVLGAGASADFRARLEPVRPDDRRPLLRHLASEINRWMFKWWSLAQIALGLGLLACLWPTGGIVRLLALLALAVVLIQAAGLARPITDLGRAIDFLPRPLPPDVGRHFGRLHGAYVLLDLGKAGLLGVLAAILVRRG